ncbi:transcriptional regulator [Terribacillus saccharophilus]|uniref:Lrp/AsnC family transcriptional regulator n=1 Tax=Terribacillus saccharophilus TaxID=361277 RepID=UPI000BA52B1E|nr:Lrp/AsnC family transcriptional regulator [Terribacillus saccharophilus]PAF21385.1 transcriptional regulator [Terribacillus saccharophilus]
MDSTDKKILEELSINGRISMKELGEKVNMSGAAVAIRVAKLEDNKIITGYSINIDQTKLNCHLHVFMNIYLNDISHKPFLEWLKTKEHLVLNSYKVSGDSCYLLECRFQSNECLDEFLIELNKYATYRLSTVIKSLKS